MEKDAIWSLQRHGYVSTIDGTRTDRCNEEIRQPGNVLRGHVVIATPTLEDHIERLDEVFACMKRSGLKCKPSKCGILKDSIKYLGRMVDRQWHQTRPKCSRSDFDLEIAKKGSSTDELLGFCELLLGVHYELCGQSVPDATTDEAQRQEIHVEQCSRGVIPENKEVIV